MVLIRYLKNIRSIHTATANDLISMKAFILILMLLPSVAQAQEERIELDQLPPLDTAWGSVQYKEILIQFYNAVNNQVSLPRLRDPYYAAFYAKLLNKENLNIFTDTTFSPNARFEMGSPFFQILPSMLVLLTDQARFNEAVAVEEFLMETMLRSTYLMNDILEEMPDSAKTEFRMQVKNGKGIYQCTYGALQVLSLEKDEDGVDFKNLLSLAQWTALNTPALWKWMDDLDQQDCLAQIRKLSTTHGSPEIKALMKQLLGKLPTN